MADRSEQKRESAPVVLVPCPQSGRAGCEVVRRAVELVAAGTPEVVVLEPDQCHLPGRPFLVALDSSSRCRASEALVACRCRPSLAISAPEVLVEAGALRPGVDVRERVDELAKELAARLSGSLREVIEEMRDRRRYREKMAPVLQRFRGIWDRLEALPPPNGEADPAERQKVELLGKRSRNLFTKFDEITPPVPWAEPHDLFQDALLCIAFATEGWVVGDARRWDQNLEKARVQIKPLLRRLEG